MFLKQLNSKSTNGIFYSYGIRSIPFLEKKFSEKGPTDLGSAGQYPQISILNISLSEYGKNTCECSVVYLAGQ